MSKIFLDTNFLVYTVDQADPSKQVKAKELFAGLSKEHSIVLSTQVLQEFYIVAVSKLGIEPLLAKSITHGFEHFEIITIDTALITEDMNHRQIIRGVEVRNPFQVKMSDFK